MTDTQPSSGADLARVALMAARKAAKNRPTDPRAARKKRTTTRRADGRDPITLGGAITNLIDERAWEAPAAGGSILDQWPTIAPELVGKVAAERFHADRGLLDLRPASPAYGTQLRMFAQQMVDRINAKTGSQTVRAIRVLAPDPSRNVTTVVTDKEAPSERAADERPRMRTRDDACPGFHQTLAAINRTPPAGQKPRLEREWGTGEYAHLREPAERFTDAVAALETAAVANAGNDPDAVRQAAIRIARAQKAGNAPAVTTVFQRTA